MSDDLVSDLHAASEAFLVPLRIRDGFDEQAFKALCDALKSCKQEWSTKDSIPKRAAAILVDLFSLTLGCADLYTGTAAERSLRPPTTSTSWSVGQLRDGVDATILFNAVPPC